MFAVNNQLLWMLGGTFAALSVGSAVRIVALRDKTSDLVRKRMGSLKVWWILAALMTLAVVSGRVGVAVLLAVASWMAMREFLRLVGLERIGRPAVLASFVAIPLQYGLLAFEQWEAALLILPFGGILTIAILRTVQGETRDYLRISSSTYWAVMLLVYGLSHVLMLFSLPAFHEPPVGMVGWVLFLVVLTEMNDIMQALVGRRIGRKKITPRVSPNKTWEGYIGGLITSITLALVLAPILTTFGDHSLVKGMALSVLAGCLISVGGFFGDINMSAIKRDAGVKDGSDILPGMGGIIDRVDSLTFTAPMFYYLVLLVA